MDDIDELNDCFSVIFNNVKESYSQRFPISCQFTVKENAITHSPECYWIGIFLVAWDSLESAVLKENFSTLECTHLNGSFNLDFDVTNSKFQGEEFYQFCFYDTETKDILGASCPFQISNETCEDLISMESMVHVGFDNENATEVRENNSVVNLPSLSAGKQFRWLKENDKPVDEDFEDTVLVHNKTTLIEDELAKVLKEKEEAILASRLEFESELKQCSNERDEMLKFAEAKVELFRKQNQLLVTNEQILKEDLSTCHKEMKEVEKRATENAKKATVLLQSLTAEKDKLNRLLSEKEKEHTQYIRQLKEEFSEKLENSELQCAELDKALGSEMDRMMKLQFQHEEEVMILKNEIEQINARENESATELALVLKELQTKLNAEISEKQDCIIEIEKLSQQVVILYEEINSKEAQVSIERRKVEEFSLEQEEMTSRLSLESEKLRIEIDNLKSNEKNLSMAHQNEMLCLRNRLSELEVISKDEKIRLKKELKLLSDELYDKVKCVNLLEAKMHECEGSFIEAHNQEKLELSDVIDELKAKLVNVENCYSTDETKKQFCKNCENGSKHALHVAIAHMQKQLNIHKKEKEKLNGIDSGTVSELRKQNEEFRLRLCMGKKAFDKQYLECQRMRNEINKLKKTSQSIEKDKNSVESEVTQKEYDCLLLQFNNLRADNSKKIDELVLNIQSSEEEKIEQEKNMSKVVEDKNTAYKLNEELKTKMLEVVDNYETKLTLLTDDNSKLRAQLDALLQSGGLHKNVSPDLLPTNNDTGSCSNSLKNKKDSKESEFVCNSVIDQQPHHLMCSNGNETVVERQPVLLSLSGNKFSHDAFHKDKGGLKREIVTPRLGPNPLIRAEPPFQVIPNRSSVEHNLMDTSKNGFGSPARKCPICQLDFPSNLNDAWKNEHVNSHFEQR